MKALKKAVLFAIAILILLVFCGCGNSQVTKEFEVFVKANMSGRTTPVVVYTNGMNLKNQVNDLQNKYNRLLNIVTQMNNNLNDYLYLALFGEKLLRNYDFAIMNALKSGNTTQAMMLFERENQVREKNDYILLNTVVQATSSSYAQNNQDLGWYDTYGNFHSFSDNILINSTFDFRILSCSSSIGTSHVLQGDTLTVTGYIFVPNVATSKFVSIRLLDPEANRNEILLSSEIGSNTSDDNCRVCWNGNMFTIYLNTSGMLTGLKQLDINYDGYTVSTQFVVVKPYIVVQHTEGWTRIATNYPKISVDGKVYTPLNGIVWVPGTVKRSEIKGL